MDGEINRRKNVDRKKGKGRKRGGKKEGKKKRSRPRGGQTEEKGKVKVGKDKGVKEREQERRILQASRQSRLPGMRGWGGGWEDRAVVNQSDNRHFIDTECQKIVVHHH